MTEAENSIVCCNGHCRRKQPILVRQGGLTGQWYAVTRWKQVVPKWSTTGKELIEAVEKHDLPDLHDYLISQGWTPPAEEGTS